MNKTTLLWAAAAMILLIALVITIRMTTEPPPPEQADQPTRPARHQASTGHRQGLENDAAASNQDPQNAPQPEPGDSPDQVILDRIHEASIQYEPSQIPVIAPYLRHPDKAVRMAAIDGLIVLGERGAADHLREAAKQLDDPREAVAFLDAADYLELPSFRFEKNRKK